MRKLLISLSLLAVSSSAQASWFQEYCSSADASTRIAQGHNENEVRVTHQVYENDGTVTKKVIVLTEATYETSDSKILSEESSQNCRTNWGFATWKNVRYQKVKITNLDGSAFPDGVVGLTKDGLAVEANVLCEENGNSETFCGQEKTPTNVPDQAPVNATKK